MNKKVSRKPSVDLFPLPAVMVTSQGEAARPNIITIAWTGILTSGPLVVYISVRPSRYSHALLTESREFAINIPTVHQATVTDYCGQVSGRDVDKFAVTGLTPSPAAEIKAPLIKECPVNLECRVRQIMPLGNHDVFIADALVVHYSEEVLNEEGRPEFNRIQPAAYAANAYYFTGDKIGNYGYSRHE